VQGELFAVFEPGFGGLRYLLEHSFILDVSSRCPYLRGPRLALFLFLTFYPLLEFLQVGLVRGTWWPAGSSASRMVARTAR
jgi:hypothetical protein